MSFVVHKTHSQLYSYQKMCINENVSILLGNIYFLKRSVPFKIDVFLIFYAEVKFYLHFSLLKILSDFGSIPS